MEGGGFRRRKLPPGDGCCTNRMINTMYEFPSMFMNISSYQKKFLLITRIAVKKAGVISIKAVTANSIATVN